jgi:ferredoxin-type protein NapF
VIDPRRRGFLRGRLHDEQVRAPRPPWSLRPDAGFTTACTRCGECVRSCPREVLRSGDGGFPVIDFAAAGCSLCGECRSACPTGAIERAVDAPAFAWRVSVDARCLTRHGVECRVCGDACDARALRFVPALGGIAQLRIEPDACTGCGDCVSTCPVNAISLR